MFDRVRTCDNHCDFCFIYQLPKGMRRSLYLKDDDYRLSFLYGNFTTLTRFTELDLERVIDERLSPLYVSIHSTDPELRAKLVRNRRGATSLRWLRALLDGGIEVHGQVVVCPGVNDGEALEDTMAGIADSSASSPPWPACLSASAATRRAPEMRPHTPKRGRAVVDLVDEWQETFRRGCSGGGWSTPRTSTTCSPGRHFPEALRTRVSRSTRTGSGWRGPSSSHSKATRMSAIGKKSGFFSWVDGAPATGYRATRRIPSIRPMRVPTTQASAPVTVITGEYGARVLGPVVGSIPGRRAPAGHTTIGSAGTSP